MLLDKYCLYYETACGYKTMCGLPLYKPTEITVVTLEEKICVCARCNKKRLRVGSTDYKSEMKSDFYSYIDNLHKLTDLAYFESLVKEEIRIPVRDPNISLERISKSDVEYTLAHFTFREYLKWLREFIK